MRELFVYYRVRASDAAAALASVQRLQALLSDRFPGLRARLLRRPDTADHELQTWMETYATDPPRDGISAELQAAIEAEAGMIAPLIQGTRHVEVFVACAS
jgi:hypothetical protein